MVFVRIAFIILVPVLAMLALALTHVYTQKYYPRRKKAECREDPATWRHPRTLVEYLQSPQYEDSQQEETHEEEKDPDSS